MDYKQILYFKTIAEEGTLSKAASKLNSTQPSISKQLSSLEKELSLKLMNRGGRNIELTPAGEIFYKRCIQILSLMDTASMEMKNYNKYKILKIGVTSSTVGIMHRPSINNVFKNEPNLKYEIFEGNTYEMLSKLESHIIDMAFVRTPFNSSDFKTIKIGMEPMVAIGHRSILNCNNSISLSDLCKNRIIIHRRYSSLFSDVCISHNLKPDIICHTDDCRTSIACARNNLGIAVVPASACDTLISKEIKARVIQCDELITGIFLIYRKYETLASIQTKFINCFKKIY